MSNERLLMCEQSQVPVPVVVVGVQNVLRRIVQDSSHVAEGVAVVQHGGRQLFAPLEQYFSLILLGYLETLYLAYLQIFL